jgi:class 3 adenylate cyclase/tetratricopeptide (TPR) repeat protein
LTPNRPELPSGTVTFLFSDVEGSTRLLRKLGPQRYTDVLGSLRGTLLAAARRAGGVEVDSQGDGSFMVFPGAGQAVAASVEVQRSLAAMPTPEGLPVRVRIGIHTGEAILTADGYVGFAVHRAARISAAAHGGQVVLSQTATDIVRDALPGGAQLRDLGLVSLKDMDGPERLTQLVIPGLPHDFPPLRTHVAKQPPRSQPHLLDRDGELTQVAELLAHPPVSTGHLLLIEGPSGIGRTALLAAAVQQAEVAEARVLSARASEFERDFSYGIVRQLFEPTLRRAAPHEREALLGGAAGLAAPLFDDQAADDARWARPDATFASLHGLFWLMAGMAEQGQLVLAIDDLHWSDAPSLRWLAYLARRLEGVAVLVLATVSGTEAAAEPDLLRELALDPATVVLRPSPLSELAIGRLVEDAVGVPVAPAFRAACHRASGGNPRLATELVHTIIREGIPPSADQSERVLALGPGAVSGAVRRHLDHLPGAAGALADAVSILGDGCALEHAAALAGITRAAAMDGAESLARAEILALEPPLLSFRHSVVRVALYNHLSLVERESRHRRAAEILEEAGASPERVAGHLLLSAPDGDRWAADVLRDAARRSHVTADVAVSYLRRALAEPPDQATRGAVLAELGFAEALVNGPAAVEHLREALTSIEPGPRRAQVAEQLGRTLFVLARPEEAVAVLERATEELFDDAADLRGRLEAGLILAAMNEPSLYSFALEHMRRVLGEPPRVEVTRKTLAGLLAYHDARALARRRDVVVGDALDALAGRTLLAAGEGGGAFALATLVLVAADRDEALAAYDVLLDHAAQRGSVAAYAVAKAFRTRALVAHGALADAQAEGSEAVELFERWGSVIGRGFVHANLADALMEQGDLSGAGEALARAGLGEQPPDNAHAHWFLDSRARLHILRGELERGAAEMLELGRRYESVGGRNPALIAWRSQAGTALAALGERERAHELAREEVLLARRWGAPRALGQALRAAALVDEGGTRLAFLREAVELLDGSPARLEQAKCLTELGAALRRADRTDEARDALHRGLDLATECGARPVAARAREELLATGAKPAPVPVGAPARLTPNQRRAAAMAAAGASEGEIAQALLTTPAAVQAHLEGAAT